MSEVFEHSRSDDVAVGPALLEDEEIPPEGINEEDDTNYGKIILYSFFALILIGFFIWLLLGL